MSMKDWAKREVEIACKRENSNWDGKSFDYGCACYQSALKTYKAMLNDGHSGYSWHMVKGILNRLMDGKPLTPITDEDFVVTEDTILSTPEYLEKMGLKSEVQCPRMSSLFRTESLDYVYGLYCFENGLCDREYVKEHMREMKPYHLELRIDEDILPVIEFFEGDGIK